MDHIAGSTAFVTGGASGIGLGIVQALIGQGARVAVGDVREDHLAQLQALADREGWSDRLLALPLDITDRPGFAAALDAAEARFGPLRILVNNAAVGIAGPVDQASHADWDWGVGVNLIGVANGLVAGIPRIKAHGQGGHIVNTASEGAIMMARRTRGIYAPTKAAVISLSEHLRLELEGSGVGVSVLCPGPVRTNIAESESVRPDHLREGSIFRALHERAQADQPAPLPDSPIWLDPIQVGGMLVDAILEDRLFIITHPQFLDSVKARHAMIEAAMQPEVTARHWTRPASTP